MVNTIRSISEVMEATPLIMMLLNSDLRIEAVNRATEDAAGCSSGSMLSFRGGDILGCVSAQQQRCGKSQKCQICPSINHAKHTLETGEPRYRVEIKMETLRGDRDLIFTSTRFTLEDGSEKVLICLEDVTNAMHKAREQEVTSKMLVRAQTMESLALFAQGVVHDLNGLVSAILTTFEMLPSNPTVVAYRNAVALAKLAASRIANRVKQLQDFCSPGTEQSKGEILLNPLIVKFEPMLKNILSFDVEQQINLSPAVGSIFACEVDIDAILLNLAFNARDAMDSNPRDDKGYKGNFSIRTYVITGSGNFPQHVLPQEIQYPAIVLEVTDTGCGMDQKTQDRIFEPFFTTKGVDKGTGLGMAVVYGAVERSNGTVFIDSEVAKGTTFTFVWSQK